MDNVVIDEQENNVVLITPKCASFPLLQPALSESLTVLTETTAHKPISLSKLRTAKQNSVRISPPRLFGNPHIIGWQAS